MKKRILVFVVGILLVGVSAFATNTDLYVNGNVMLGTTTPPVSPIGKLYVNGPSATPGAIQIDTPGQSQIELLQSGSQKWALVTDGTNLGFYQWTAPGTGFIQFFMRPGGNLGLGVVYPYPSHQLELSGDAAKPGGGSWAGTSDARVKTNIKSYKKGLKEILQINPVTYNYNGKGGIGHKIKYKDFTTVDSDELDTELLAKTFVGILAHEIQPVIPETVSSHKGKINKDDADETDILDFDSSALTFILINAVKDLSAQVDSLNQQIADLKGKVK